MAKRKTVSGFLWDRLLDVVVWFEQGVLAVASERKVAGEMFWWPSSFVIQAYHDGEFLLLEKA